MKMLQIHWHQEYHRFRILKCRQGSYCTLLYLILIEDYRDPETDSAYMMYVLDYFSLQPNASNGGRRTDFIVGKSANLCGKHLSCLMMMVLVY